MKPETFGRITLYNADCMDVMRVMPDKAFDLAIVDPPYGINAATTTFIRKGKKTGKSKYPSGLNYVHRDWDNSTPNHEYFHHLFRVSKNQIIWGGNYFIQYLKNTPCMIVWDKDNGKNKYSDCELAWSSFKTGVRKFKFKWHGMLQEDMKNKEIRIHPTQKPVALYKWLLANYASPGDKILDTHLGSGSICIACDDLGFDMTGIELDPDYYQAAKKRIINHQAQQKLF